MRASEIQCLLEDALGPERPRTKQNDHAEREFAFQCRAYRLVEPTRQHWISQSAHPDNARRRWRFDFCFVAEKLLVEIDGGIWMAGGGAHSKPGDIERNMRKRNDAALLGYTALAFTPRDVKAGTAIAFTQRVLHRIRADGCTREG
jgi:very-short-patch-repair endonuclease